MIEITDELLGEEDMMCIVPYWNLITFFSPNVALGESKLKGIVQMRIANKRQLQSYFCFLLLIILDNLGLIFHLQITNKKIHYRGRLKHRFME